ncbi:MAG: tetratricopeptide repeat protein [Phycisphaerae bacterium]|nr:tetratricopeptide repeat protein [Phycisphaerae bacterium]
MTDGLTVDQVLRSGPPQVSVNRRVLARLLRERPDPEAVERFLSYPDIETVRAVVLYLGVYGSLHECPLLALCLQHPDCGVVELAEYGLMSIWMQSGTKRGNRHLAAAIGCIKEGDYTTAIHLLSMLAAEEPSFSEAFFQRGLALCYLDRHDEAGRAYRQALRLNPYHFGAAAALGHTCIEQGNMAGALHFYRHALRIHPRLEDLPEAVRQLECLVESRSA